MKSNIQLFLEHTAQSFLSLAKVVIQSKFRSPMPPKSKQNCIILANGPSLKDSLRQNPDAFDKEKYDLFCVNYFANTDFYERLKPNYCVLIAPEYWVEEFEDISTILQKRTQLFENIEAKTDWEMTILIPWEAKKSKAWKELFKNKPNIHIQYFNRTPVEGCTSINHFLFKHRLGMPRPHNVLLPSIWLTINMHYQNIYLVGSDHSWLPEISVNDQNEVLINQKHFYDDTTSVPKPMRKATGKRKLYEVLEKFMLAFKGYFILNKYAKTKGVKIWNSTPNSFIDAFERKEIVKEP
ncbi:MAG: hypothetical protein R3E32_09000 [Chitinophagales bacterium]